MIAPVPLNPVTLLEFDYRYEKAIKNCTCYACRHCGGKGFTVNALGLYASMYTQCPHCKGTGND